MGICLHGLGSVCSVACCVFVGLGKCYATMLVVSVV